MKKSILCLAIALTFVLLGSASSFAVSVTHDAVYHWATGGTRVVDSTNFPPVVVTYDVGNPTGGDFIEVWEKAKDNGLFEYTLRNDNFQNIYSFHVPSSGIPNIISHTDPTDWTFSMDSNWFTWVTTTNPLTTSSGGLNFAVLTYGTGRYAISTAAVNDAAGNWYNGNGYWVTSHPVPEPATTSLLGLGLLGFVGRVIRRKARA